MDTKTFDCKNMPKAIREAFYDSYRQCNNTEVRTWVNEERKPIQDWLIEQGADESEEVVIKYRW